MGANTCRSPRGRALMLLFASVCRGNCSCQLSSASSYPHKAGLPGSFSRGRRRAAARPGTAPSIRGPAPRGVSSAPSPPGLGKGCTASSRPTAQQRRGRTRRPDPSSVVRARAQPVSRSGLTSASFTPGSPPTPGCPCRSRNRRRCRQRGAPTTLSSCSG